MTFFTCKPPESNKTFLCTAQLRASQCQHPGILKNCNSYLRQLLRARMYCATPSIRVWTLKLNNLKIVSRKTPNQSGTLQPRLPFSVSASTLDDLDWKSLRHIHPSRPGNPIVESCDIYTVLSVSIDTERSYPFSIERKRWTSVAIRDPPRTLQRTCSDALTA